MNSDSFDKKTAAVTAAVILAAVLSAVLLSVYSEKSSAAVMLIVSAAVLTLLMLYCGRKSSPVYITLTSVMTALSVVGRIVFAPVSGFKPCTAIIIVTGITLGPSSGFICGAFTALISNIYMGQGMWTLFQMISWGTVGFAAGLMRRPLNKSRVFLYVFAAASGFLYSALMDMFSVVWQDGGFNPARFVVMAAGSLPFVAVYAVSNVIFLIVLYRRLSSAVNRIVLKYGVDLQ